MGTVIQDTYTGVLANLTSHSPDVNVPTNGYTDLNFVPALQLTGGGACNAVAVHATGSEIQGNILQNSGTGIADGIYQIDVIVPNQAVVGTFKMAAGLIFRLASGSPEHYWLIDIQNSGGLVNSYEVHLQRRDSSSTTPALDVVLATGLSLNNSTHTLAVTCLGSSITPSLDGVPYSATINTTYQTGTGVGPFMIRDGTFAQSQLDNLSVTTLTLTITTATLPNGQVSSPYSQTISSTGGYQPTVTYAVTAGALPPGLSLSAGGVLSGTPTTAGVYPFSITASDSLGDSSAPVMYTVTITGGSMSRLLVRPDAQQTPATRRFQQEVAQILNGLSYSGSIIISSGGIITIGGIAIGATVTGGTYTGGTGGDVLFVGVGGTLAQDNNFTFLETALGGPILTVNGGLVNVPGGLVTAFRVVADSDVSIGSVGSAGALELSTGFPIVVGFIQAKDDVALIGTAGYLDWGNVVPGPNFPSHLFENTTGGLVARAVVGILKSDTAPLLAGLADIITATPFLFSIDQTGYFAGPGATFTGTSATTFVVTTGTNTIFQVDCSVGSAATGVKITGQTAGSGARVAAISSGTNEALDLDPKGTQTVNLNSHAGTAANAGATVLGSLAVTSTSATALTVGRQGATNPAFRVSASAATQLTGILITGQTTGGTGALISVISSATNESLRIDAKGSGTIGIGLTSTGIITLGANTAITGTETITSTSASALAVGRQGATNPVLQVDASTGTVVTGVSIKGNVSGGGVSITVISTASNEGLLLNAIGSGSIQIGSSGTGTIFLGNTSAAVIQTSGSWNVGHVKGNTSIPAIATGTGAGTNATASISGTDTAGTITVNTSNLDTPAANATIVTVTFSFAYGAAPFVLFVPANAAAWALVYGTVILIQANVTTAVFLLESGATPLPALTTATYKFNYHVFG